MAIIIGNNAIGSSTNPSISMDTAVGCKFTVGQRGTVKDINVYTNSTLASANLRFAIYNDNGSGKPTSQVWASPANNTATSTPAWYQEVLSQFLTAGVYWFYWWIEDTYVLYFNTGTTNQAVVDFNMTFPTWENPFDGTDEAFDAANASIYVTFEPEGSEPYLRRFHKPALFKPGNAR